MLFVEFGVQDDIPDFFDYDYVENFSRIEILGWLYAHNIYCTMCADFVYEVLNLL